jgi:Uma2 family endonuclease
MPTTALVTSEQYLALPDEFDQHGNRIRDELIGGEIVKMPPASQLHDLIKNHIHLLLIRFLDANRHLGLVSLLEFGTEVGKYDTFVPDISVIKCERLRPVGRIFRGAPDLAIEIASPSDTATKLKKKVDAYLKGGSRAVWVFFADTRSVTVYSAGLIRELKGDEKLEDPLLPGFSTPVSDFFELS